LAVPAKAGAPVPAAETSIASGTPIRRIRRRRARAVRRRCERCSE